LAAFLLPLLALLLPFFLASFLALLTLLLPFFLTSLLALLPVFAATALTSVPAPFVAALLSSLAHNCSFRSVSLFDTAYAT
jgi:hypothetical protein